MSSRIDLVLFEDVPSVSLLSFNTVVVTDAVSNIILLNEYVVLPFPANLVSKLWNVIKV